MAARSWWRGGRLTDSSAEHDDAVAVGGDLEARRFIAFWHRHGMLTAAMTVNVWDVVEDLRAIVASGRAIDANRLADRPPVTSCEPLAGRSTTRHGAPDDRAPSLSRQVSILELAA